MWDKVEGHIKRGLDGQNNFCSEDILEGLCNSSMQLWCWQDYHEIKAALVTTIQFDSEKKWCLLLSVGGDSLSEWSPYLSLVEEWAKGEGCTEMQVYGRIGWARQLNYTVEYTKMSKGI